ncbi:Na+-translocating ferredoxin:NAD+ oxidoreductase subunit E, partial [Candidatus Hakubella thermalkaliphila]
MPTAKKPPVGSTIINTGLASTTGIPNTEPLPSSSLKKLIITRDTINPIPIPRPSNIAAFAREAYAVIGLYIQLIVAFASILARAEMFGSKNSVMPSMFDGLGMGIGFMVS